MKKFAGYVKAHTKDLFYYQAFTFDAHDRLAAKQMAVSAMRELIAEKYSDEEVDFELEAMMTEFKGVGSYAGVIGAVLNGESVACQYIEPNATSEAEATRQALAAARETWPSDFGYDHYGTRLVMVLV